MAQLPSDLTEIISQLNRQTLEIIHIGTAVAFDLNAKLGETDATLPFFDELQAITEDARDSLSKLHNLQLMVAESQPLIAPDVLRLYSVD